MPNNTVNTDGGGSGAIIALLAILVIAVIAFGIWYTMGRSGSGAAKDDTSSAGLQINVGGTSGGSEAPATQ